MTRIVRAATGLLRGRRNHDDGDIDDLVFKRFAGFQKLNAVHFRHHEIQENQAWLSAFLKAFHRSLAVFKLGDLETLHLEDVDDGLANVNVVLDYDNIWATHEFLQYKNGAAKSGRLISRKA